MEFNFKKIVVIGCSRHPEKDAYKVPAYLREKGFEVYCVNPFAENMYHSLEEVPREAFEVVDLFRPPEEAEEIARKLIELNRIPKVFWLQEGSSPKARKLMESRGVKVVENACMMKTHQERDFKVK